MRRLTRLLTVLLLAISIAACGIPEDQHNAVVKDLEDTKMKLAETQSAKEESEEQLNAKIAKLESRIAELEARESDLETQLAEATAELSMYQDKTGGLEQALKTTKSELDELRKQKIQQEKRLAEYRKLTERLANMVKSGQLKVKIRNGQMVIELANNILFDSGKTDVKEDGQAALSELSGVLSTIKNRRFLVAGHTDNVPISSNRYSSNWELSTARAVNVVEFLQEGGVPPTQLAAAGFGEHDPVASNEDDEGKALNRRIEIMLMPNLDELPKLPKDILEG